MYGNVTKSLAKMQNIKKNKSKQENETKLSYFLQSVSDKFRENFIISQHVDYRKKMYFVKPVSKYNVHRKLTTAPLSYCQARKK